MLLGLSYPNHPCRRYRQHQIWIVLSNWRLWPSFQVEANQTKWLKVCCIFTLHRNRDILNVPKSALQNDVSQFSNTSFSLLSCWAFYQDFNQKLTIYTRVFDWEHVFQYLAIKIHLKNPKVAFKNALSRISISVFSLTSGLISFIKVAIERLKLEEHDSTEFTFFCSLHQKPDEQKILLIFTYLDFQTRFSPNYRFEYFHQLLNQTNYSRRAEFRYSFFSPTKEKIW